MARRRINTRFIVIFLSSVGIVGATGAIVYKVRKPRNPQPYIMAGDAALKNKDYPKAITNLSFASDLLPDDAQLHLKLGAAFYETRNLGAENLHNAVVQFTRASQLDPNSKDAWKGLLEANEVYVEIFENRPFDAHDEGSLPLSLNLARDAAEHLVKLDPDNIQAKSALPILIIRVWLLNLTMPQSYAERNLPPEKQLSPDQHAEQAIVDLTKMMHENPENEKIPYWIARAKIFQAQQALKTDHPQDAVPLFSEASNEFDASINLKPDVIGLYVNKGAILSMLQTVNTDPRMAAEYRKDLHDTLDKAQSLANPKNASEYQIVKQQWARNLSAYDPAKARIVYEDLIEKYPNELGFRIDLARLLSVQPDGAKEAIALLSQGAALPGPDVTNAAARQQWEVQSSACRLTRAEIEVKMLRGMPAGKERTDLIADIQSSLELAKKSFKDTSAILRIQGNFQLANDQVRDAILTLTQAADKMSVERGTVDPQLLREEAEAYLRGQQTQRGIELLEKAVTSDPNASNNAQVHKTLAELYLQVQDFDKARPHVKWLAERFGKDPRIVALQILSMGPNTKWDQIKPLWDLLPEEAPADITAKYGMALQLNNKDEAIRLLTKIHTKDPGNVTVASSLAQLLINADRKDDARKVVNEALAVDPKNGTLNVILNVLDGKSTASIEQNELDVINQIPDPFQRELKLAQFYQAKDNPDEEMVHLKKALAIQPDNRSVLSTVFARHLDAKRFPDAAAMLQHLTDIDADDAHGLMFKTKLALAQQDVPNALIFSRQMTHDFSNFAGSWEMYGEALRDSGQLDLACQQFVQALSLQSTNADAAKNLIQCSVQQNKLEDARQYIKRAASQRPGDPTYREMRIQFEIMYGKPETVLPELQDALQKNPEDPHNYGLLADALLSAMRAKTQLGQSDSAKDYLNQARDIFQKAVNKWPDDLRFANALSQMLVQTGDLSGAADVMKAISQRPRWQTQPAPLILMAKVLLTANKPVDAEAALHKALDIDARSADAHLVLADSLILQQKYEDALAVLQPATSNFAIRAKYTDLLIAMGRGAQAEASLEDAIKESPTNIALVNLMLHVYDAQGKFERGIRAATDDITAEPRNLFAYYWRGKMLASTPNPDLEAAIKDLSLFRDAVPKNVEGRIALAVALEGKHDREGAIHELELAAQFEPQNRQVRLMLLREYSTSVPPRLIDADRLLMQSLAIPVFQHDPDFEIQAAMMYIRKGDNAKAVAMAQDAMQHSGNKNAIIHDYFAVLMATKDKQYQNLLLDESKPYVSDPKTSWFIFSDRGVAKAALGDLDGAKAEFITAMDRAGTVPGSEASEAVAVTMRQAMGVEKALEQVLPRAENSVTMKLIAVDLLVGKGDIAKALTIAESAMASVDSLSVSDRFHLYQQISSLYLHATPVPTDKAIAIYQKMLEIQPDNVEALNDMACVFIDMSSPTDPKAALAYSQRAYDLIVKSGKLDAHVYDTQGWVLIQNKRLEEGLEVLHKVVDQSDFPDAHYHLAMGYLQMKMANEAQTQLSKASDILRKQEDAQQPVDSTLKGKIESASKQADDMSRAKDANKAA